MSRTTLTSFFKPWCDGTSNRELDAGRRAMFFTLLRLRSMVSSALLNTDDDGTSVVEYALLLALIAVVAVIAVGFVGEPVSEGLSAGGQGFAGD
jgi:Flp pilus assembly pilin Flp